MNTIRYSDTSDIRQQQENFQRQYDNGSVQSISNFENEQTRAGVPEKVKPSFSLSLSDEKAGRMQQSANLFNTPYMPDWKPRRPFQKTLNRPKESDEEVGFHFTIAKLNCNYSPAISKFSVSSYYIMFS